MTTHSVRCQACKGQIRVEVYHLGFSDMDCMYCDSCPSVLLLVDHARLEHRVGPRPAQRAGEAGWEEWNRHLLPYFAKLESLFRPCACGGSYRAWAVPRCPKCNDFLFGRSPAVDRPSEWGMGYAIVTIASVRDVDWMCGP